jgi:hypothetical protein
VSSTGHGCMRTPSVQAHAGLHGSCQCCGGGQHLKSCKLACQSKCSTPASIMPA